MDETRTAAKMEQASTLGNPKLRIVSRSRSVTDLPMPRRFVGRKRRSQKIALLRHDRGLRLVFQLALARLRRRGVCEKKAVVRGHDDIVPIEIVDNVADQGGQFIDGSPH